MISDEAIAKRVLDLTSEGHSLLMGSLTLVQETCSDEEYKEFESKIAQALGQPFFLVMEPLYREHPALAPADTPKAFLDAWRKR